MDEKQLKGKQIFWSNKWDKLWLLIIPVGLLVEALTDPDKYGKLVSWLIIIGASAFIGYVLYHMFHPKFVWVDTTTIQGKKVQARLTEQIFTDLGVFAYSDAGFDFTDIQQQIHSYLWADIESIFGYKRDLFTVDELNMDVVFNGNRKLHLTEETPGWYQFIDKLKQVFPQIDREFEATLMFPPFETNMTLVYDSQNRTLQNAMQDL